MQCRRGGDSFTIHENRGRREKEGCWVVTVGQRRQEVGWSGDRYVEGREGVLNRVAVTVESKPGIEIESIESHI
jgi:hypothetical protein